MCSTTCPLVGSSLSGGVVVSLFFSRAASRIDPPIFGSPDTRSDLLASGLTKLKSGRGGRDRPRRDYPPRDYPPRSEDRSHHKRSNPPSRHLWIGNLSHSLTESTFTNHLLRFGELDSVAFQPGRSYAFVNYKHEEGAFAAMKQLQGFVIAGNSLRIEFAKAEKSSPLPRGEEYLLHRDERPSVRGSPLSQRESRTRYSSLDPPYLDKLDKPKASDRSAEPSPVLWIGFPSQLKVDEFILRKAFSPFGEIDRITAFPGRTYAFVRFKNVSAACRAKETLQGKLFGNPRVNICFARSESGTSNRDRSSMNSPPSPHFRTHEHQGFSENFRQDRNFGNVTGDHDLRSPRYYPDMESSDPHLANYGRKENLWAGEDGAFEQRRYSALGSELGPPGHAYELQSPPRKRLQDFHDFSPPQFPRRDTFYDDQWDLPEDALLFHEAKKLKPSSYHPDNELPEYPLSDSGRSKQRIYHDYPQVEILDKNFDSRPVDYRKIPDRPGSSNLPYGDENDRRNASLEGFQRSSRPLATNSERRRLTPEARPSSVNKEWKWEGTIAKGGTPVCRARCFPVGQPLDMNLPEYLDCTARTSLDMLANHYYQATGSWVVFFAPANDPDIAFYNEFMNYLGEKQRAAVAKLDDCTTLFLVPPSEFSEKVLKVPGKLSMSGLILRLDPSGFGYDELHGGLEKQDTNLPPFQGMASYANPVSPTGRFPPASSGPYPSGPSYPTMERAVTRNSPFVNAVGASPASFSGSSHPNGKFPDPSNANGHEYRFHQRNQEIQNLNSSTPNIASQPSYNSINSTITQEYDLAVPRTGQESSNVLKSSIPSATAMTLQPEQLAQLTSSLLGQQAQPMVAARGEDFRQPGAMPQSENAYRPMQNYVPPNNHIPEFPSSQFAQVQLQPQQQMTSMPPVQPGAPSNPPMQSSGQDNSDPETRLQATLQLAAALLKQIQQGKGN
nr:flowering time control protein FPA [Ipomoea batatas]